MVTACMYLNSSVSGELCGLVETCSLVNVILRF